MRDHELTSQAAAAPEAVRPSVNDCGIIDLPQIQDPRGSLTFVEGGNHIPFEVARVYYLYDIRSGASRAGHSHLELEQVLIAVSGAFTVTVDDGYDRSAFLLSRPFQGLYIPAGIWREIDDFSSGGVCLALASARYEEADYIRDYDRFVERARRSARP